MRPPSIDDGDVRIWQGDALETLREMPSESVQMIVTSPPFWGLRDYGTGAWSGGDEGCDHLLPPDQTRDVGRDRAASGGTFHGSPIVGQSTRAFKSQCGKCGASRVDQQIGLEETPDEWCAKLVAVMREARRVLRSDGVCWIEVGDTYASNAATAEGRDGAFESVRGSLTPTLNKPHQGRSAYRGNGIKGKDLVGAPWLLAFALRADGWYLRSDTIWSRPNPMPESVTDRPTKAHSYVFLLSKSSRYYFDADSIREAHVDPERGANGVRQQIEDRRAEPGVRTGTFRVDAAGARAYNPAGRNARSVWSIPTEPTPFAHFATFPQALVERCIKAGTSEHGACGECGAPWRRITERGELAGEARIQTTSRPAADERGVSATGLARTNGRTWRERVELGWSPSCECSSGSSAAYVLSAHDGHSPSQPSPANEYRAPHVRHVSMSENVPPSVVPCVVLDPFMGSGTTALVARRLGRHAMGIELNAEYLSIAATRLQQLSLLGGTA